MQRLYPFLALLGVIAVAGLTWHHVSPANKAAGCHQKLQEELEQPPQPAADDRRGQAPDGSMRAADATVRAASSRETATDASRLEAARTTAVPVPMSWRGKILRQRLRHFPHKLLALTFDDGPSTDNTPIILEALREHNARATFFVLGRYVKLHPELVKQALDEGHAIGNHSYRHPSRTSPAEACSELDRTSELIEQATNQRPQLFRPPYGITRGNLCQAALKQGNLAVMWTISSADSNPIGPEVIARNVIHTPNPGDIILMHDGPGHAATAQAVPQILRELTASGFQFVTVPELLQAWDEWEKQQGAQGDAR